MGPLADRRRPGTGGARPPGRAVGARPPRPAGQPRGASNGGVGPGRTTRPAASSAVTRAGHPKASSTRRRPGSSPSMCRRCRQADLEAALVAVGARARVARRGRLSTTRAAWRPTRTWTTRSRRTPDCRRRVGLPLRVHACMRDDALDTALARRAAQRAGPWAPIRTVAPGSAGRSASPTARSDRGPRRLLEDIETGARPAAPAPTADAASGSRRRTSLTRLVARAAAGGIATQIHAIGDAAVRAALDVLTAERRVLPLMPRDRARPDARPGRPRPVRRRRDRRQRPARPPRLGRGEGATAVGRAGRGARLHVGLARADRRRRRVRDRRPGRAVRPVARDRAGGPPRGSALAGRHARRSARRGALAGSRPPRGLRRPGASRRGSWIAAG